MAVLIASDLAKDISGTPLLRGVSLKLERRDRLTIAGRNGAGKTTLLRMLAGETSIDGGELVFAKGTKVALHDQRPPRDRDITLREYVQSANKDLIAQEERLQSLEQAMATGDETVFDEYARVQTAFDAAGGYTWRERATQTIHGLGFTDEALDRQLSTFSGGQLTRASLARALAGTPDLLLLDEPTNHLDIESLEWLEKTLLDLDAAIVLVAHDRWFLETVGTAVLEVEAGRTRFFPGTWAQWRKEAAAREMALGRAIDKQQKEIERMERFVERFRAKATKAKQAQSRVKALNKMERIERDPRDKEALSFEFAKPERTGRVIFELEDGKVTIGDKTLLEHAELWLERGEHVTLVGANGTGKTTLIETLAGERELAGGKLRSGHNLKVGYLSQHGDTLSQGGARTVLEATIKQTGLTPNKARALLGRFLFSGEDAEKELSGLSGGERQRVSLAILVSSGANVLILDEPTNHLDLESREALEDALSGFEGAVLLITHDRALLDAVGTRTVALEDQRLHSYIGGWPEYVRVREERKAAPPKAKAAAPAPKAKSEPPSNGNGQPKVSKNAKKRLQALEREIEQAEAALAKLEEELAAPDAWDTPDRSAKNTERHTAAKRAVEEAYARWEAASA
ncbi:ABC-F family ATP-binding cassette domain-containing protein [Svornostia abyssi]|uniref:ABC-F family ATP-binding cassette domain-containing protein n=1 Tax=Svornostia abyssi TaxID=2898438 RepID=A0ABY5PAC2_9ACTN|nr:ABC-F family ATP-binding cassette domain-containing protein [Parviterribacteraceae bacterium J379]